ncbi:MAG: proprotein convertase P-domain-containing protein [Verrucomicrobiae bacterium]|nr:proprotein convertase P-domain-containing protein [Verrucomicrobiae bacterium]
MKRNALIVFLHTLFILIPANSVLAELATPETVSRDPRPRLESRAGNSVDTATGAFRQELTLLRLQDYISLEFGMSYNSFLTSREGDLGYGWSHPYEGRIESVDKKVEGDQIVYLDGNVGMRFRYAGEGKPFTPLDVHNRYDILEIVPKSEPDLAGLFRLRLLSGRSYIFMPGSGQLIAILNRNKIPIVIDYVTSKNDELPAVPPNSGPSGYFNAIIGKVRAYIDDVILQEGVSVDENRIARVTSGDRQLYVFYHPIRYNPFSSSGHLNQIQYLVHGDSYTFFQYDEGNRLSRFYDPVTLETVAEETTVRNLPDEGILQYQFSVSATETDRLIRVRPDIVHPKPWTLTVRLQDPSGNSVQIHANDYKTGVPYLFLGDFLGRNPAGTWTVTVQDVLSDGVAGTINGFRMQRSEQAANWTQYHYDSTGNNRLLSAFDSKNELLFWNAYDANGRVERQGDGRQDTNPWRFTYEDVAGGDLITTVHDRTPSAHASRFRHGNDFNLREYEDALGNRTRYTYEFTTRDRLAVTDARGNSTTFTYDINGLVTSITDPKGFVTRFGHDEFPLRRTDGSTVDGGVRGNLTTVTDALNCQSKYHYDEFNRLVSSMNALDIEQTKNFDQNGNLTVLVNKEGTGVEFGHTGGMMTSANMRGGPKERLEYDSEGRVVKIISTEGHAREITYDKRGNITEKSNALGHKILSEFDHRNRKISETDAEGNVTRIAYDGNGNRIRVTDALDQVTHYAYDAEDRLITVTDPGGNIAETVYDAAGRVVAKVDPLGHRISYAYDEAGNQTAVFSPTGIKLSETTYDKLGNPETVTDASGNRSVFEYDVLGQRITKIDPLGQRTRFKYDLAGRLEKVIDPSGRSYQKTFLEDDVVDKVIDADGKETRFTYTDGNQVASIRSPGGAQTNLEYTWSGHVSRYTPPTGKSLEYAHNEIGRLERSKHLDPAIPDIVYAYDRNGNVTQISTQANGGPLVAQITRTYDALGRRISNTDAKGNTVRYAYNGAGLVSQLTYPDSKTVDYAYDAARRLRTVTDWAGRVTEYTWNADSKLTSIQFPNGTTRSMAYDETGRLLKREDFDILGFVIVRYDFTYDGNGFLISENLSDQIPSYEASASQFTYDADNRLIQKDGMALSYDAAGNIVELPIDGQSTALAWSYHNNLIQAGQIQFSYDVEDRLLGWQMGGESMMFTTVESANGSQILASESSSGDITRYVYGIGLAYEETNGQIKVHHYDERGNTTALSDEGGRVSGTITYSPFGVIFEEAGDTETLFKYSGLFGVVTAPNGLNHMRLRWYSPEIKRFLSVDSSLGDIRLPSSLNRYIYAANNPINFNDPEGEFINILVGAVVGAVVGATVEVVSSAIEGKPVNWNNVAAAAIGGAVAGGITGACPGCGSIAGAVGAGLTNGLKAAFNGKTFDGISFAIDVGVGLLTGAGLDKAGVSGFAAISGKLSRKKVAAAGAAEIFTGALSIWTGRALKRLKPPNGESSGPGGSGNTGKYIVGATSSQTNDIQQNGEYQDLQQYQAALQAANRLQPDPPVRNSSF